MTNGLSRADSDPPVAAIEQVAAAEEEVTGRRPLGESMRTALHRPGIPAGTQPASAASQDSRVTWLWQDAGRAYAAVAAGPVPTVELTADPRWPRSGPALLADVRTQVAHALLWSHGDRSAGRQAAQSLGLREARQLWVMVRETTRIDTPPVPTGIRLRAFDPDRDAQDLLDLNRQVFAHLPDQAGMDTEDLTSRLASPWYEPDGFIVAEGAGRMVGFHWTKIDPRAAVAGVPSGEVYLFAVSPEQRGSGLAAALLAAGLQHLGRRGLRRAHLFVDASNTAAVRRYEASGFARWDGDRQYEW